MKKGNLITYLNAVPDERRQAGCRHNHTFVLLIILMSTMSGYVGYRAIGSFIKRNRSDLLKYFGPNKDRVPSFATVRRVIKNLDFEKLSAQFYQWACKYVAITEGEWVSMDGKAIGGTVAGYGNCSQHFINLVSLYCSKRKLVLGNGRVQNSKESEIPVVQELIETLDITGVTFTLDALHCQKKRQRSSLAMETTMS